LEIILTLGAQDAGRTWSHFSGKKCVLWAGKYGNCHRVVFFSEVSGRILMPIEIFFKTKEIQAENQLCRQILLPPHDGPWSMLFITAAKGVRGKGEVLVS